MRNQASVEIDRPVDDVFRLTNDHVAEWSITVIEDQLLDKGPTRVGTKFRTLTEENGQQMEFIGEVTEYDPPHRSAVHLVGDKFDIDAEYVFDDLSGRTRVTQISYVHGKGLLKVFFICCGWMLRRSTCNAAQLEMESLKRFCESKA